jgi:hypothetical protein
MILSSSRFPLYENENTRSLDAGHAGLCGRVP